MHTRSLFWLPALVLFCLMPLARLHAQVDTTRPHSMNTVKFAFTQLVFNEARIMIEREYHYGSTVEFGAGYIYPNAFWREIGWGTAYLSSGFILHAGMRRYTDPKRYFRQTAFRSYISPGIYYQNSSFRDKWFYFPGDTGNDFSSNITQQFQQMGARLNFGMVNRYGRFVFDLYTGIGVKFSAIRTTENYRNEGMDSFEILPTTLQTNEVSWDYPLTLTVQAGFNIGLRGKNKTHPDSFYHREKKQDEGSGDMDVKETPF